MLKNCWILPSSVPVPFVFLGALLKVSTNLSANPFNLGWYGEVVMWSIPRVLQNVLNSLSVNWIPLAQAIFSGTPKRANSSVRKYFVYLGCWSFALKNFRPFGKAIHNYQVIVNIHGSSIIYVEPGPLNVCFWPWCEFYWRCFRCQLTPLTSFNNLFNIFVHICLISEILHQGFRASNTRMPLMKFLQNSSL